MESNGSGEGEKQSLLLLRNGAIVMIQSSQSKLWISYPQMRAGSFGSSLVPVPTISANAMEAMFFQIRDPSLPDDVVLNHQSNFQIILMEHVAQNRPVLTVAPTSGAAALTLGAPVYYGPIGTKELWQVRSSTEATDPRSPIRYGRPHYIQDIVQQNVLSPHGNQLVPKPRQLGTEDEPHAPQLWTLYPVATISTCENVTKQCTQTGGHQNAFIGLQCETDKCTNKFGELVYENIQTCQQECELSSPSKEKEAVRLTAPVPVTKFKPPAPLVDEAQFSQFSKWITVFTILVLFVTAVFVILVLREWGKIQK